MARHFNQAELIASELAMLADLSMVSNALYRVRDVKFQSALGVVERQLNQRNIFMARRELVRERRILLVDDVYVTGSTLNEAARVLKKERAYSAWGLTVARSLLDRPL